MSHIENNKPLDRNLMKSSQILNQTFNRKGENFNHDLNYLVNPQHSDAIPKRKHEDHLHDHSSPKMSNFTQYLLLVALCLDGFFEGIALGVQSTWKTVSFVAFAIIFNKIAVGFGLGISLKKADTDIKTFIRFIILFSLFTPFGIVLGYFFGETQFIKGILLAISAGTFTYVSCSVVIVEEFAITRHRYSKYSFFFLGGVLTATMAVVGKLVI